MNLHLKIVSILVSFVIFVVIIDLVRRKKLREELSLIWLLAGAVVVLIALWDKLLYLVSRITGIIAPTSAVFSFGILFLILVNLQLSSKMSRNEDYIKNLIQRLSLLEGRVKKMEER
ncbi:MAG: DUF2304 domain-containing protein [Candidatus Omnitrophica bacterium]|nr:DUF2304 domain-containing protein [Candidatus Omnitrophota bacterium]